MEDEPFIKPLNSGKSSVSWYCGENFTEVTSGNSLETGELISQYISTKAVISSITVQKETCYSQNLVYISISTLRKLSISSFRYATSFFYIHVTLSIYLQYLHRRFYITVRIHIVAILET